jgi:hypothetical protein
MNRINELTATVGRLINVLMGKGTKTSKEEEIGRNPSIYASYIC